MNCSTHASPTLLKVMVVPLPKLAGVSTPVSAPALSAVYMIVLSWPSTPSARVKASPVPVDEKDVVGVVKLTAPGPTSD